MHTEIMYELSQARIDDLRHSARLYARARQIEATRMRRRAPRLRHVSPKRLMRRRVPVRVTVA